MPYPLHFLFASRPEIMSHVLGIVYRCIATHLCKKAGLSRKVAQTGAVTLIQRFGSALNLNVHFHMLFLDGVYVERQGLLERDAENSYLTSPEFGTDAIEQMQGASITYRIAVGPQQGRKVFTLQTLPACEQPFDDGLDQVAGFSLHAGVAAKADQRKKLERLCRYIKGK